MLALKKIKISFCKKQKPVLESTGFVTHKNSTFYVRLS